VVLLGAAGGVLNQTSSAKIPDFVNLKTNHFTFGGGIVLCPMLPSRQNHPPAIVASKAS
jgi:hypothetical protein